VSAFGAVCRKLERREAEGQPTPTAQARHGRVQLANCSPLHHKCSPAGFTTFLLAVSHGNTIRVYGSESPGSIYCVTSLPTLLLPFLTHVSHGHQFRFHAELRTETYCVAPNVLFGLLGLELAVSVMLS